MAELREVLLRARLDGETLEAWVAEGWIAVGDEAAWSERDIARACLIRDLREELGVNDDGVAVALGLLDQVHGLRLALRRLVAALGSLPEPLRGQAIAALRAAMEEGDGI